MRIKRLYGCHTSFLDLLFNMLLAFTAMFVMAFAMMHKKEESKSNTEVKAEYVITISWPDKLNNDVDSYLEDPDGHLVCFRRREDGLMHLDRDDLGTSNDMVKTQAGQSIEYPYNREMITLRGISEGEYCMNVHAYRFAEPGPCEVTVQLDKLNPTFSTVLIKKVVLEKSGDEKTVIRFKLTKKGELLSTNTIQKSLLSSSFGQQGLPSAPDGEFAPPPNNPIPNPDGFSPPPTGP